MILEDYKEPIKGKITKRIIKFQCDNCQNNFIKKGSEVDTRRLKQKYHYCCIGCTYQHRNKMEDSYKPAPNKINIECFFCKKEIKRWKSQLEWEHNFCGKKCHGQAISVGLITMNIVMTDEIKEKIGKKSKKRLLNPENHPLYGKHHTDETREKISKKHIESGHSSGANNPMFGQHHTEETKQLMSEIVSREIVEGKRKAYGTNFHQKGLYFSIKINKELNYRSSWELATIKWLDNNDEIITYEYEKIRIVYYMKEADRNHKRNYIPDFLITFKDGHKELWELKPQEFTKNEKTQLKAEAAIKYCRENNILLYKILTKEDLQNLNILI